VRAAAVRSGRRKSSKPKLARQTLSTDVETLRQIALNFPGVEVFGNAWRKFTSKKLIDSMSR
jgi:hypothetical protein